ncbi:MAG: hypothetical protein D6701_11540, partial [Gemmatimonadetes bacterium]
MPRITLLTDFGMADGYVGAVKGVLAAGCPGALLDDVAHDLAPGDVNAAAAALRRYWARYPEGTVHLVVVDPGVGTDRRALAVEADGRFVVAPDNGVLAHVLTEARAWRAVALRVPEGVSATFHGRDVFAPAAARLAAGEPLEAIGTPVADLVTPEPPPVERNGGVRRGRVVVVDRFGTLHTNLPGGELKPTDRVRVAGQEARVVRTYGDAPPGTLVA